MEDYIQQVLAFDVRQGVAVRVEKMVTFFTSRDPAISDTLAKAGTSALRYVGFEEAFARHASAWDELWRVCDVRVPGDDRVQLLLRLHICHILQVCSHHTADLDAGVPARGLNGEAYRGHVFWDELYVYPFLNFRMPEVTRGLLMYRYRRLGEAQRGGPRGGAARRDVPVAERQRGQGGDPARASQPALGPLGARPQPQPAARQRGDLLQHLALLPDHRGPGLPARLRRGDDAGDRPLLGLDRPLQSRARALRDPRRDGAGRVPREVPRCRRGRPAQQRLHQRHGGVAVRRRAGGPLAPARDAGPTRCAGSWASATTSCARGRT